MTTQFQTITPPARLPRLALAGGALALCVGLAAPPAAAQLEYCEENGSVILEIEDHAPSGDWVEETTYNGFTGSSYFSWGGSNQYNNPGKGVLSYTLNITTPGDYELRLHNHHNHPDSTLENDCWTRMDGGTWVKTYSGQTNWNWATRFEYSDHTKEPAHFNLTAGLHTFEISGRSENFRIDRAYFSLSGTTSTSTPPSPQGNCNGPTPHPAYNPRSVTGVFSDGTFGPFETRSGTPVTLPGTGPTNHRYLAFTDSARMALPDLQYTDQDILLQIKAGMPDSSWIGVILRAEDDQADFAAAGGTQSMIYLKKQAGTGNLQAHIHDGTGTVFSGPLIPTSVINSDARSITMRITTSGDTVRCTLDGMDALGGGYTGIPNPGSGGITSLRTNINPSFPGTIGLDYALIREAGDIPDVHFDANGKLWISALETDLLIAPNWQPNQFLFEHEAYDLGLFAFVQILFPYLDYQRSDSDHFLLGVIDSGLTLPEGSSNSLTYKGQTEGGYQP